MEINTDKNNNIMNFENIILNKNLNLNTENNTAQNQEKINLLDKDQITDYLFDIDIIKENDGFELKLI